MSQTAVYIQRLEKLREGELSRMRRLVGRPLDATLQGFDLFAGLWWPLRAKSSGAPRREASWMVAKVYASFRIPHVQPKGGLELMLPAVLGRCEPRDEHAGKRFRDRFDALLCSPLSSLELHLRWALGEVAKAVEGRVPQAREVKGIDWVRLLDDISIWDRGEQHRDGRDVRDTWAEAYLSATEQTQRRTEPC